MYAVSEYLSEILCMTVYKTRAISLAHYRWSVNMLDSNRFHN